MQRVPITLQGFERLQEELKTLKSEERPAVIRAIAAAREHGDLSENAEYHAARERQSFIEGRIAELEDKISRAEVIDPSKLSGDAAKFGATVTLADCDTDEEKTYQLVGETDFLLKIVAENWESYNTFLTSELTKARGVSSVRSALAIRASKFQYGVPIDVDKANAPAAEESD